MMFILCDPFLNPSRCINAAERADSSMESSDPASGEQNLRRLKKKLRQIEQLRQRDAAKLDADAQRKLLQHVPISLEIEMLEALLLPSTADGAGSSSIVDDVVNLPSPARSGGRSRVGMQGSAHGARSSGDVTLQMPCAAIQGGLCFSHLSLKSMQMYGN